MISTATWTLQLTGNLTQTGISAKNKSKFNSLSSSVYHITYYGYLPTIVISRWFDGMSDLYP